MLVALFQRLLRPRSGARVVSAVLGIAVAGCSVGPDFEAPKSPSVTRYTSPGEATAASPDPGRAVPTQAIALGEKVAADWWTLFRSSDLDLLVKQAVAGSRTLESVKAFTVPLACVPPGAATPVLGVGAPEP